MKQGKITGILFAVLNLILLITCAVLYLKTDRTCPEIEFSASDAVYVEGGETDGLLDGVRAYDKADGDITERVVVEKITLHRENRQAVVYYAVSDRSGNVAKASRVFDAVCAQEEEEEDTGFLEAGINAEMNLWDNRETAGKENGGDAEKDSGAEEEPGNIENQEEQKTPEPAETAEPETAPERTPKPAETAPPTPEPEPVKEPVPAEDPSAPVLTLKVSEVKVKPGQGPAWVDLIGRLSDDRDTYETLFHNLTVSKYDKDKAGSYAVSVYTEDSDGNRSQSVPLTILVE